MSPNSPVKIWWYYTAQLACRIASLVLFRIRVVGREQVPATGGVLVCANHQSNFDPVLVGVAVDRRLSVLARQGLFRWAPFRWLIQSLNAIPVDRDGSGVGGLKETLRRLRRNEIVLIFPEGTRTRDGEVAPLKSGFLVLLRRGRVPLLPIGIDGAYEAWPRHRLLPRWSDIHVFVGEPIETSLVAELSDEQLLAAVQDRLQDCHRQARMGRERRRRKNLPATAPSASVH